MPSWPNLSTAGAPRCGTSSLHAYLDVIPGVFKSRSKEPICVPRCVIGEDHPMARPIRGEDKYRALIDRTVAGARVIASPRDPDERLFSHYPMMRNNRLMDSFAPEIGRGLATDDGRSHGIHDPRTGLYAAHVVRHLYGSASPPCSAG
jgi:hypothetical protein